MANPKMMFSEIINMKLSAKMKKELQAIAKRKEIPLSVLVRDILRERIEREATTTK